MATDLDEAIARARAAEDLQAQGQDQVGLTAPDGTAFDPITAEDLQGPSDTFDPNSQSVHTPVSMASRDMADTSSRGVSGSWDQRPGAQPSPLPAPSAPFSDNVAGGAQWASLANPEFQAPPPRAELVRMPPAGPVSMASRDMVERPVPRATLVDPDPDEQYFNDPDLANAVKRAQLVDPDPDNQYLPQGQENNPEVRRAALIGQAIKRATLVDPDPDQAYLDAAQELQKPPGSGAGGVGGIAKAVQQGLKGAQPAQKKSPDQLAATTAPSTSPSAVSAPSPSSLTFDPNTQSVLEPQKPQQPEAKPQQPVTTFTNPDGSASPARVKAPNGQEPVAIIFHHTSGRGGPDGVRSTLAERHLGVQYIVDRDGNLVQGGGDGKSQILKGWGKVGTGLENNNTVGVEFIAKDNNDITPAQLETAKKIGAMYPNANIFGHGEVNPGHKEANEGASTKAAALTARAGTVATPAGAAEVNVTHFGYRGDPSLDSDSAAGRGKYVENMVPGYDVALNAAAAAKVGNPKPGEEFTYAGRQWRYGDQVPEKYQDARFDIFDPNNQFSGGLPRGAVSTAQQPQRPFEGQGFTLVPAKQEDLEQARSQAQAALAKASDAISALPEAKSEQPLDLYNRLSQDVKGVTPLQRQVIQNRLKTQIVAMMRQQFPDIKTDAEAWIKATTGTGLGDIAQDFWRKVVGNWQQFTTVPTKAAEAGVDQFAVNRFLASAMPKATEEQKHEYLQKLYALPLDQRAAEIESKLGPGFVELGNPNRDPQYLAEALDRLADPKYQEKLKAQSQAAVTEMKRNVAGDPRLAGTGVGKVADALAPLPAAIAFFYNPVTAPMALAQVHNQMVDGVKAEHPDWDDKAVQEAAVRGTITMFLGQEVANALLIHGAGPLVAAIESPAKRVIAAALTQGVGMPAIGAATQAGVNIATGAPVGKGVGEAAITGAIQGGVGGLVHGGGELARGRILPRGTIEERPPVAEERPPTEEPVRPEQPIRPEPAVEPSLVAPPVTGEQAPLAPVTREDVERRAYEISQEREQTGRAGDALSDWAQAQQELANADVRPVTQGESEPWVSAIANRFTTERMATGELGPVEPGQGVTTEEMLARGLKMTPEQINQHVSDLMHGVGDPRLQAAAVRAEESRLSQRSHSASLASEADPSDRQARVAADNAFKDLTDFHNGPVARLKNNWHAQGMTLQNEIPVDLSTYNGLREAFLKNVGKPSPDTMEPVLRKTAKQVRDVSAADAQAFKNIGAEIAKDRRRLPSDDQVTADIMKIMKVEPCPT